MSKLRLFLKITVSIICLFALGEYVSRQLFSFVENHKGLTIARFTAEAGNRLLPNIDVTIKNHKLSKRDVRLITNSLGYRDDEILEKKANEIRILVLGDSITWGSYLPKEEVYVERVEHYLNKHYDNKSFQVINSGVGDIGIREEIDILKETGLSTNPDYVILAFYLNDSRPPWGFANEYGSRGFFRKHSVLIDSIYLKFKLFNWINAQGKERFTWMTKNKEYNWKNSQEEFLELAKLAKYDWGAAWENESWEIIETKLSELHALSKRHNFKVIVLTLPAYYQVYANFVEDAPQKKMQTLSSKFDFAYLDLLPALRQHRNQKLFYDQCHPVPLGNEIIGKAISKFLIEDILKEP